jgi:hypothetical protein
VTRSLRGGGPRLPALCDLMQFSYGRAVYDFLVLLQSIGNAVERLGVRTLAGVAVVVAVFAVWLLVLHASF